MLIPRGRAKVHSTLPNWLFMLDMCHHVRSGGRETGHRILCQEELTAHPPCIYYAAPDFVTPRATPGPRGLLHAFGLAPASPTVFALDCQGMYFRAMTPDPDGLPRCGSSARSLGVRVPQDVRPDAAGYITPGTGGMSVAPDSLWNLPHHRRPRGMGRGSTGPEQDYVFSIKVGPLQLHELQVRPDPRTPSVHALVEPMKRIRLEEFQHVLVATRPNWTTAWP